MSKPRKPRSSIQAGDRSVVIGGNASGNIIITGDGNVAIPPSSPFESVYRQIAEHPHLPPAEKADARAELQELEREIRKPEPDVPFVERRLRNLRRIAPDILDVVLATISSPATGFSMVVKKVAERMRAEALQAGDTP